MKAIRVHSYGGPEVLKLEEVPVPEPEAGEIVIKLAATGVNFFDIYTRLGQYKAPHLPYTPGREGAGTVTALGPGVTDIKIGDRVATAAANGTYAEYTVVRAWKAVALPDAIDFRQAAAIMLQGMTAHYLAYSTFPLKPGHTALIHAGAGGVGLLLTQISRRLGATVYATVGSEAKAAWARQAGANEVIIYTRQDFEAEVNRLTDGRGVDVVYDSVGAATFEKSLSCLRTRGYLVLYGQSSGPVPPISPTALVRKGSLFLTRPALNDYTLTPKELLSRANDLFRWVASGDLSLRIDRTFALSGAAEAHEALGSRETMGKVLLLP